MRSISKNELRSSEHVSPSHPDKVCDLIAERLLWATKQQNPDAFFACDGSIKNNVLSLVGEVSDRLDKKEENRIIYDTLEELGYGVDYCEAFDLKAYGSRFGWYINKTFTEQSHDINIGVVSPKEGLAAGDIGIMFGYAVDEAPDLTYLPHWIARVILRDLYGVWKDHRYTVRLRPDMKCLVTMGYLYGKPVSIKKVVVCVSHAGVTSQIAPAVLSLVKSKLDYIVHLLNLDDTVTPEISINPTGEFSIFGPVGDSGCVAEGEVVLTTKGMARIEDIQVGDVVLTEKGEFPVYQVLDQGEKETVIVTDRHGHSVRVTPDHPFAVFTKNGIVYKEAKDLTDGDEIVRVNRFSEWDNRPTVRKFKVGRASREIFNKIIGNELTRKQVRERVRDYEYLYSDRRSYPRWAVKPLVALDQKLYLRYNLGKYVDATVDKLDNRISIQKLTHILNIYGVYKDTPEWQLAHSLTNYDLVSLASVEKAGICRCYDLNVETDHSFTANGFLVHNCVGRKVVCDQYGGAAPVGGGNLNGKDVSKVDRTGVYMARYMAKKIVWEGLAREAVVQLAYEIGKPKAVSVNVRTDGTPFWKNRTLRNFVKKFDTSVPAIIERFGLNNLPEHVHDEIAAWGHIGERAEAILPWEVVR